MDNVIVAALDADTETLCKQHNIPYHSDKDLRYTFDVMATGGQPLHDPNAKVTMEGRAFQQIGALKAAFLLFLLNRGHRVLVSDVDTVWLNDPREWFERDDSPDTYRRRGVHGLPIARGGKKAQRVLGSGEFILIRVRAIGLTSCFVCRVSTPGFCGYGPRNRRLN